MTIKTSAYMKNTAFKYTNAPSAQKGAVRLRRHTLVQTER